MSDKDQKKSYNQYLSPKWLYSVLGIQTAFAIAVAVLLALDQAWISMGLVLGLSVIKQSLGLGGALNKLVNLLGVYGGMCFFYAMYSAVLITFVARFLVFPSSGNDNTLQMVYGRSLFESNVNQQKYQIQQYLALAFLSLSVFADAIGMFIAILMTGPKYNTSGRDIIGRPTHSSWNPSIVQADELAAGNQANEYYASSNRSSRIMPSLYQKNPVAAANTMEQQNFNQSQVMDEEMRQSLVRSSFRQSMFNDGPSKNAPEIDMDRETWYSKFYGDEKVSDTAVMTQIPDRDSDQLSVSQQLLKQQQQHLSRLSNLYRSNTPDFSAGEADRVKSIKPLNVERTKDGRKSGRLHDRFMANTMRTNMTIESAQYPYI
ncbi:hypothetical protein MP228_004137 [Amoeboaphelidium protococcarum]|nr:hypothetical protein MP228_004137 [Amoeboaphelidium protococcarum]